MKYDVFISYSRKDYAEQIINEKGEKEERIIPGNIVSQTIKCLESNKISYWWDKDGIYSADQFIAVIAKAIRESSIFLFISTENSNESYWTPKEISAACHLKKKIIPFKVDDSYYTDSVLLLLSDVDFIDYSKDKKKAFEKLEVSIKKILEDERLRIEEERKRKEEEEHRRQEEEEKKKEKEKEINKPIKKDAIYYAKTRHWSVNVLLCGMFVVAFGFGVLAYLLKEWGVINIVEMWLYISLAVGGVAGLLDILLNNKRGVYILLSLMVIPLCVFIMGYAHTRIFTIPIVFLLSIYIILICIMPIKKNGIRAYNLLEKGRCWISKSRPRDSANVFPYVLFIIFLILFIHGDTKYKFYKSGSKFKEGMMAVGKYGKYGFIDTTGREVIPFIYDYVWDFSNGRTSGMKDGKMSYIDTTGKEVYPSNTFDAIYNFSEGLACVERDEKRGFIDTIGQEIIPCIYDWAWDFSEGLACVEKDGKWGYIDKTGKEVIPLVYDSARKFSAEGFAAVKKAGHWGFIDKTGKEVIPYIYDEVWDFSEGFAAVKKAGHWGFIDKTGKEVIPYIYDEVWDFSEGLAQVNKAGHWGYIDKIGNVVIPFIYDYTWRFSEGLARVEKDGKHGSIDKTGKEVIPCIYDEVWNFSEGLALVNKAGKYGFIDKTGKEVVPCIYDFAEDFSEGLASVGTVFYKTLRFGFIDTTGREVVSCRYQEASNFSEGMARVKREYNDKWGYVDKTGKEVVPYIYDFAEDFSEGLAKVEKNGDVFFIDKKGNRVID